MNDAYTVMVGTSCIDEYYHLESPPILGEKALCTQGESQVGGMVGNAAAVHAALGGKTYCIDFMNNGSNAERILDDMVRSGVDISTVARVDSLPDTKCLIMLYNGERTIFVLKNGKKNLMLTPAQQEVLNGATYVYTTVPELLALQDPEAVIQAFRDRGARLALDVEEATFVGGEDNHKILRLADLLFINSGGHQKLLSSLGAIYMEDMTAQGCILVHTKGAEGCEVHAPGGQFVAVPGHMVEAVDTTGAGDTFNASFVYGLGKGWDLQECARFANGAAARAIGLFGPRSGAAPESEVQAFLHKHATKDKPDREP